MPNLSYVKKRQYRAFLILNTEQTRQYRRKNRKGFRRFWLEKTDITDNFLRLEPKISQLRLYHLLNLCSFIIENRGAYGYY